MLTFHIPAHAGSDYAWDYSGNWSRTVDAIDRRSIHPKGLAVFSSSGDEFVSAGGGYVVQTMSEEQYEALPASLRRRLDTVRARGPGR